jgi:hypothetical protein
LRSLSIARSLGLVDVSAISGPRDISVEAGSFSLSVNRSFLSSFDGKRLSQSVGSESIVKIGLNVEVIGARSSSLCKSVRQILFDEDLQWKRIRSQVPGRSGLRTYVGSSASNSGRSVAPRSTH